MIDRAHAGTDYYARSVACASVTKRTRARERADKRSAYGIVVPDFQPVGMGVEETRGTGGCGV